MSEEDLVTRTEFLAEQAAVSLLKEHVAVLKDALATAKVAVPALPEALGEKSPPGA